MTSTSAAQPNWPRPCERACSAAAFRDGSCTRSVSPSDPDRPAQRDTAVTQLVLRCVVMVTKSPKAAPIERDTNSVSAFDAYFRITQRGSTVGREIRGGLVTFFTMAYIIALNPF